MINAEREMQLEGLFKGYRHQYCGNIPRNMSIQICSLSTGALFGDDDVWVRRVRVAMRQWSSQSDKSDVSFQRRYEVPTDSRIFSTIPFSVV